MTHDAPVAIKGIVPIEPFMAASVKFFEHYEGSAIREACCWRLRTTARCRLWR